MNKYQRGKEAARAAAQEWQAAFSRSAMSWGELADAAGESDPAAVVLFKFTGWSRCPEYERAV